MEIISPGEFHFGLTTDKMVLPHDPDEALGLSPDEIAFYDALANNESAMRELGDEVLKKNAQELTEKPRASTTVDWQVRDSVRAKMRNP